VLINIIQRKIVAKRRKEKRTYKYECTMTEEKYVLTQKAENPDELMSVTAFYDMNPELDDRTEDIKKKLGLEAEAAEAAVTTEE
jgi:hypothetical protein